MKGRPVIILLSIVFFCSMTTQLLAARSANYGADTSLVSIAKLHRKGPQCNFGKRIKQTEITKGPLQC
jgi:hypothetical protein